MHSLCYSAIYRSDPLTFKTRFNLYVTILLAALIPDSDKTTELLDDLYMNAIVYSLAILITALVQTFQGQLDLYHAIIVMQMQVIIHVYGKACVYMRVKYRVLICREDTGTARFLLAHGFNAKRMMTIAIQAFELLLIFVPWLLYLWIKDSRFGAQPECNDFVKYVLVFVTFRATVGWIRILAFIWVAVIVLMVVGLSSVAYKFHMDQVRSRTESSESRVHTDDEKLGVGYSDRKDLTDVGNRPVSPNPDDRSSRFFWAFSLLCVSPVLSSYDNSANSPYQMCGLRYRKH